MIPYKISTKIIGTFLFLFFFYGSSFSKTVQVGMWTDFREEKNNMRYDPRIVSIDVGDTVFWKSYGKDHNVEFLEKGIPKFVEKFNSNLDEDVEYTFYIPGIYAYICTLHLNIGMIGFIIVDNNFHNLPEIKKIKYSSFARRIAKNLIKEIEKNYKK